MVKQNKTKFLDKINNKISLKVLSWIMLIMSLLGVVNYVMIFFQLRFIDFGIIVSILGIIASILIFKKKLFGNTLALIWSALQVIIFQINTVLINFKQFFDLSFSFKFVDEIFIMLKINFLALLLFYLFFKKRGTTLK